jgi:hypothetical protein
MPRPRGLLPGPPTTTQHLTAPRTGTTTRGREPKGAPRIGLSPFRIKVQALRHVRSPNSTRSNGEVPHTTRSYRGANALELHVLLGAIPIPQILGTIPFPTHHHPWLIFSSMSSTLRPNIPDRRWASRPTRHSPLSFPRLVTQHAARTPLTKLGRTPRLTSGTVRAEGGGGRA